MSKDGDFSARSFLYGGPPKVIWLAVGNRSTDDIERYLRAHRSGIQAFADDPEETVLVIEAGHRPNRP